MVEGEPRIGEYQEAYVKISQAIGRGAYSAKELEIRTGKVRLDHKTTVKHSVNVWVEKQNGPVYQFLIDQSGQVLCAEKFGKDNKAVGAQPREIENCIKQILEALDQDPK